MQSICVILNVVKDLPYILFCVRQIGFAEFILLAAGLGYLVEASHLARNEKLAPRPPFSNFHISKSSESVQKRLE